MIFQAANGGLIETSHLGDAILGQMTAFPFLTDEDFDNGGIDLRVRKNWGDGTMWKGSTLTLGASP